MKLYKALLFTLLSFSAHADSKFDGVWRLVSGEYLDENGTFIQYHSVSLRSQKIIYQQHYSFVSLSGDKFWSAGNGTISFDDSRYVEHANMTSYNAPPSSRYEFRYELQGNRWTNSRYDQNGQRVEWEIWQRVTP